MFALYTLYIPQMCKLSSIYCAWDNYSRLTAYKNMKCICIKCIAYESIQWVSTCRYGTNDKKIYKNEISINSMSLQVAS